MFCLLLQTTAVAADWGRDTITVDGTPLNLALDVRRSDAGSTAADTKGVRPRRLKPVPFIGLVADLGRWTADVAGTPVSSLSGRPWSGGGDLEAGLTWSSELLQWQLVAAGGWRQIRVVDLTSLEDSAVSIAADGRGGLEQHTVQTYELGIELDTLPLQLQREPAAQWELGIRLGGPQRPRQNWNWWVGASARWSRVSRGPAQLERLPAEGVPEPISVEDMQRLDWVPLSTWGWVVTAKLERRWSEQWAWSARAVWCSGPRGRVGLQCGLTRHLVR